jgi:tetratricopeptide (TPR) repeat protein
MTQSPSHYLILAVVLANTALVYWFGLHGGFIFDDYPNIVSNQTVQIPSISFAAVREIISSGGTGVLGRPLSMLSFALNHAFSGLDPFAFKAVNLIIHLCNGLLIFWLARALLRLASPEAGWVLPIWVAAAWLLHPINLTSVLLVVQRMTELSALFTLAGLLLYLHLRISPPVSASLKWVGWLGVLSLWLLGFLGKESAVLAPLFALLIEVFLLRKASEDKTPCAICVFAWLGLFAVMVAVVVTYLGIGAFSPEAFRYRDFSMAERAMTELRVLWFYVQLILIPMPSDFGLFHDDITVSRGWLMPWTTLVAGIGWLTVLVLLVKFGRRVPLIGFGVAWFLVGHLLESTILPLEIVHEHRNYLPAFGLILAVGEAGRRIGIARLHGLNLIAATLVIASIAVLVFNTALRAYAYGNPVRLARTEAAHHPNSSRSQYEAGRAMMQAGSGLLMVAPDAREEIQAHFHRATALDPSAKQPLLVSLRFACMYRDPINPEWSRELARRWQFSRFGISDRTAVADMQKQGISGRLCMNLSELRQQFQALLANPDLTPYDRAMAWAIQGNITQAMAHDPQLARDEYRKAMEILPSDVIRLRYAQLLFTQKDYSGAEKELNALSPHAFSEDWQPAAARELQASLAAIKHATHEHSPQTSGRP